ncbi:MAG: hypothetical protein ACOYT4_01295 [Nanoarchaeota archaeon]
MVLLDLHYHALPSFEDYWINRCGYAGKNILEEIMGQCASKNIQVCAITSDSGSNYELIKHTPHDRFGFLLNEALRSGNLKHEKIGENILEIKRNSHTAYILNSQTIKVYQDGRFYDILTLGTNKVPNNKNWDETFKFLQDNNLPVIAEHALCTDHNGIGLDLLIKFSDSKKLTAIEHNSQLCLPNFLFSQLPILKYYAKNRNIKAKEIADKYRIPYIATSDGNVIEHLGISSISIRQSAFDPAKIKNENEFLQKLVHAIQMYDFKSEENYSSVKDFFKFAWMIIGEEYMLGAKKRWEKKNLESG